MSTVEELQVIGVSEFIKSKGHILSAYEREYKDLERGINKTSADIQNREKEYDNLYAELYSLRDQLQISEKYITEVKLSKNTIHSTVDQMNLHRNNLIQQELVNKQEISNYNHRFNEMKALLSNGFDWHPEQIDMKNNLEKERDFLQSKHENKMLSVVTLRTENETLLHHATSLEENIQKIEKETDLLDEKLKDISKRTKQQHKHREQLEKSIFSKRDEVKLIEDDINERKKCLKLEEKSLHDLELNLKDIRQKMEDSIAEYNRLYHTLEKSTIDLDRQKQLIIKCDDEIKERTEYNHLKQNEFLYYEKECKNLFSLRELGTKKIKETEAERATTELKRDSLIREISSLNDIEMLAVHREKELHEKQVSNYERQIDLTMKKVVNNEKNVNSIQDMIDFYHGTIKVLKLDISNSENINKEYQRNIDVLSKEKEKYEEEIEQCSRNYYVSLEELKLQDVQIKELQTKIADDTTKLRHKQNTYESIRSDRNLLSKQVVDSQDNINALKKTFKSINYNIEQLKDEISVKDHDIVKEHFLHHAVDKERELIRNELIKINKQISASDIIINNQSIEILKLNRILEEGGLELQRQQQEFQYIRNEKNSLTSQIIKRNIELTNIYNVIKLQKSNMYLSEKKYFDILLKISALKSELKDLILTNNGAMMQLNELKQLKFKYIQTEKVFRNERIKNTTLQEELNKPMNVHRWRVLEASDPKRFEKITYIQQLQKQLISKSNEINDLELLIQEKEKVYVELKTIISRQVGVETEEQLLVYQQTYKEKAKQLEAMEEELHMYREQIRIFKGDVQRMDDEMVAMKKQWIKMKLHQSFDTAPTSNTLADRDATAQETHMTSFTVGDKDNSALTENGESNTHSNAKLSERLSDCLHFTNDFKSSR